MSPRNSNLLSKIISRVDIKVLSSQSWVEDLRVRTWCVICMRPVSRGTSFQRASLSWFLERVSVVCCLAFCLRLENILIWKVVSFSQQIGNFRFARNEVLLDDTPTREPHVFALRFSGQCIHLLVLVLKFWLFCFSNEPACR